MYQIYIDKEKSIIKVEKLNLCFQNSYMLEKIEEANGELLRYNHYYHFCTNRKKLVEYGRQIKQQWINECKQQLEALEKIKI